MNSHDPSAAVQGGWQLTQDFIRQILQSTIINFLATRAADNGSTP